MEHCCANKLMKYGEKKKLSLENNNQNI